MVSEITPVEYWRQVTSDSHTHFIVIPLPLHVVSEVTNQVSKLMVPNPTKHIVADVQVSHSYCIAKFFKVIVNQQKCKSEKI